MQEPWITTHAAKQILRRRLNPEAVIALAKDAMAVGLGSKNAVRVTKRGLTVVVKGNRIITAYRNAMQMSRCRRNKRKKRRHE